MKVYNTYSKKQNKKTVKFNLFEYTYMANESYEDFIKRAEKKHLNLIFAHKPFEQKVEMFIKRSKEENKTVALYYKGAIK